MAKYYIESTEVVSEGTLVKFYVKPDESFVGYPVEPREYIVPLGEDVESFVANVAKLHDAELLKQTSVVAPSIIAEVAEDITWKEA